MVGETFSGYCLHMHQKIQNKANHLNEFSKQDVNYQQYFKWEKIPILVEGKEYDVYLDQRLLATSKLGEHENQQLINNMRRKVDRFLQGLDAQKSSGHATQFFVMSMFEVVFFFFFKSPLWHFIFFLSNIRRLCEFGRLECVNLVIQIIQNILCDLTLKKRGENKYQRSYIIYII